MNRQSPLWSTSSALDSILYSLAFLSFTFIVGCGSQSTETAESPTAAETQPEQTQAEETPADESPDADSSSSDPSSEPGSGEQSSRAADQPPPESEAIQISNDAFRTAAYEGRLDTVRTAIKSGTDVNAAETGRRLTALHMAAFNGHTETVKFLVENGATVDCRDHEGKTPLLHACTGPFAKTVEFLADAGADVNAKESTESFTPLMMAAGLGEPEVVEVLLRKGADKTLRDDDNDQAIDHARNSGHGNIVKMLE